MNFNTKKTYAWFIMMFSMPIIFQAVTAFGFILPAGASSPNNILQNKNVDKSQFNAAAKSSLTTLPTTAIKIRSANLPSQEKTSTSTTLHNASSNVSTADESMDKIHPTPRLRGEHESGIVSRLLYIYASQLLDISSVRQIDVSDALPVPGNIIMNEQVPALERIYTKCKAKAYRQLEKLKSTSTSLENSKSNRKKRNLKRKLNEQISKSESLILAKAIILHQKNNLVKTGLLRLFNTLVQAFPAILVSRLLKFIESGDMHHPSKPIIAAVQLISLLSLKMIVENLYFHNVVKCATMVRGSLTGLVFDKSLRLSSSSGSGSNSLVSSQSDVDAHSDEGKKKMKKSNDKQSLGAGGVLNLMQSDVAVIESAALQIHTIWDGLLQITIYSTLLYKYLGPSVFYGIAVLLMTIPTNSVTLRVLNRLGKYEFEAKDARTKRTSEAITNMKLLKLQGWEKHFRKNIEIQREEEIQRHINRGAFRALNNAISNAVPAIVLVVTLTAYRRTGNPIVASTIFTAISLFNQLRFPLLFYPMVVDSLANGKNSIRRLSAYLNQEELIPYVETLPKQNDEGGSIELRNGNFLWSSAVKSPEDESKSLLAAPALCSAELIVKPGEIVAVVGEVGSGKTALIKGLLGELEPVPRIMVDGTATGLQPVNDIPVVKRKGNVAYCAQESWLSKGTIEEAIVFGRDFDEKKYLTALYDSGLDEDFIRGTLSHDTQVGEGGSSLSGGQRARVQLARALYDDDTGVYLLDDPLSALDAAVGATVFERVIARIKARNAAALFVTNDPSLPRRCDKVILMGNSGSKSCSKILDVGTYDQLLAKGHNFESKRSMEKAIKAEPSKNKDFSEVPTDHADIDNQVKLEHEVECITDHNNPLPSNSRNNTIGKIPMELLENGRVMYPGKMKKTENNSEKFKITYDTSNQSSTIDEQMSTGAVPRKTYLTYLKSVGSPLLIVAALGCFITANGAQFFQQYTVAKWTELSQSTAMSSALSGRYLQSLVYAAIIVSTFLWLRSYLLMRLGTRASKVLHSKMLHTVFNAPSTFFDMTPSGQIMSRFGKELETVDRSVPDGIGSVLFCFLQIMITVLGLAGVVTPRMLFPVMFVGVFYRKIMAKFRPAARDLKRCESKTRSPIYTHFGETLRGVETIRSFSGSSTKYSSSLRTLVDRNLSVFYSVKGLDRWLSVRLETLGNIVVLLAAISSVILTRSGQLKSGSAGWGLTQSLAITGLLTWAVRVLTDLETQMMSVMRVTELTNISTENETADRTSVEIPQEYESAGKAIMTLFKKEDASLISAAPSKDKALIKSGWPWKGEVTFNKVSMRYNPESSLALDHVTLTVPSGSTLGVVGRTGSGKSSLLLTLFRLIEIESGGEILIDGVDIRSISLQTLRKTLSIIPQDPTLFSGTLMYNLDATGNSKPDDAWQALEAASPNLAEEFRRNGQGLDTIIDEGGKNFSAGQRQLICLARALLRRSKILVLDEATSSVDPNTDAQVQETIRREFVNKGVSVITVAHRLDTVMTSDKIAVLGNGKLIEYGKPQQLLQNNRGHLKKLVDADTENKRKGARSSPEAQSQAIHA